MTRVLLIGRVDVIYDIFSEPKVYPALHVRTHAERRPEVPIVFRRVRVRHNLDRDYFYHCAPWTAPAVRCVRARAAARRA